eukprot:CAMPEP_0202687192 /NCGR_PEP_ID=MMETSP1385-20130828/2901_1 /ASSEMBLY_ACC=CAM_ASM_000861 /TAXON_ID=933848 /ORGANISM="Elphidium margaritaceum" /LENGTH=316 /DNA_ID=CAMNT_0049341943 /DNA_START=49 /DNA_END=999 /DNA_ORIENTATION=-
MLARESRKRKRTRAEVNYNEESDSAAEDGRDEEFEAVSSEEEEQYQPPKKKRQRRSVKAGVKKRDSKDQDDDSDSSSDDSSSESDSDAQDEEVAHQATTSTTSSNSNSIQTVSSAAYKALQQENKKLKSEVKRLNKELATLRKQKSASASSNKAVNGKKKFEQFRKALVRTAKLKKTRFYGWSSDIEVEQSLDFDDFKALFDGKGNKIQPTPQNKPKSVKTIIVFNDWQQVKGLFDGYGVSLARTIQVSLWKQGNIFRGKSEFRGTGSANVGSLVVEHNRSSQKMKMTFNATQCEDNDSLEAMVLGLRRQGFNVVC